MISYKILLVLYEIILIISDNGSNNLFNNLNINDLYTKFIKFINTLNVVKGKA